MVYHVIFFIRFFSYLYFSKIVLRKWWRRWRWIGEGGEDGVNSESDNDDDDNGGDEDEIEDEDEIGDEYEDED